MIYQFLDYMMSHAKLSGHSYEAPPKVMDDKRAARVFNYMVLQYMPRINQVTSTTSARKNERRISLALVVSVRTR